NLNVNSATQVTLLTPPAAAAGVKDVRVTKGADVSPISAAAKFTYVAAVPIITTIEPNTSSTFGGQEVTIIGAGFSGVVCPGAVKFGTVPATSCTMVNDTTLKAVTPPNVSGQTVVTVTTSNGTSDIIPNFTYKSPSSGGGTAPPPPGPAGTITYSLTFRWTLLTWFGRDGISIGDALRGYPPTASSDVTARISAIFRWDAEKEVYKGYFTLGEGIPGANDFTALTRGAVYWIATLSPGETSWTVQTG
ncbi:MAG: IPT/TIG domain-containing protein, partial [Anaerolineaceae bacterium]